MPWRNDEPARRHTAATYGSAWRKARLTCLRRARWRCELRLEGCAGAATQADHIVSPLDGGTHDQANLRAACEPCHRKRTAQQGGGWRRQDRRAADPELERRTAW